MPYARTCAHHGHAHWHQRQQQDDANALIVLAKVVGISVDISPILSCLEYNTNQLYIEMLFTAPNLIFDDMTHLEDKLIEGLLYFEAQSDIVQSITGFDWIVCNI